MFIGAERDLITIHTDLLPDTTKTYIAERNIGNPIFQLPSEDVTMFQIYRLFLYTGIVYSITNDDQDSPDDGHCVVHADAEWARLAQCYLLASVVKDERFANAAIDAIVEKMTISDRYPTGLASEVYQGTSKGDNLRKLLVDVHLWKGLGTWLGAPHDDSSGPTEFKQEVYTLYRAASTEIFYEDAEMPWEESTCLHYHVHENTAPCHRCMN